MISADEAIKIILESVAPCGSEEVFLKQALGKYLLQPLSAPIDLPSFDHSAMDGYAMRCGDTEGASQDHPVSLKVVGTIAAGDLPDAGGGTPPLQSGFAFRIMTGAMIPSGADAVIPFEETIVGAGFPRPSGQKGAETAPLQISKPVSSGYNIRKAGEDVRQGNVVLEKGTRIHSRNLALLAALGIDRISVSRTPRVVVVSTGNELVSSGAGRPSTQLRTGIVPLPPGKVHNSNGPALIAALAEIGIPTTSLVSSSDDEKNLLSVLKEALSADVVITIGGVSAGDFDRVPKVLSDLGSKILFHKVAIKPGKPLLFAVMERAQHPSTLLRTGAAPLQIFGLPGNPVSALMVFDRFVRPALLKMMGAQQLFRPRIAAKAAERLIGSSGKEDYLRVVVSCGESALMARLAGRQSAANLLGLSQANACAIIPAEQTAIEAGGEVAVEFLGEVI